MKTKLWWMATGALLAMALLFMVSLIMIKMGGYAPHWQLLKVFSEAAMVGALADWFAVVALFRHPLGLPIPHTAVLAKNKGRVAKSIASFMGENFLKDKLIQEKILSAHPTSSLVQWCLRDDHRDIVMSFLQKMAPGVRSLLRNHAVETFVTEKIKGMIQSCCLVEMSGQMIDCVKETDIPDKVVEMVVGQAHHFVRDNRQILEREIAENIPLPSLLNNPISRLFVNEGLGPMIAPVIVDKLTSYLQEIVRDSENPWRLKLRSMLMEEVSGLPFNQGAKFFEDQLKEAYLQGDAVSQVTQQLIESFLVPLLEESWVLGTDEYEQKKKRICEFMEFIGAHQQFRDECDIVVAGLVSQIVHQSKDKIQAEIENEILGWETTTMLSKIEEQVGGDLQFIRLNGTIVGGIVGVLLYMISNFIFNS